MCMYMYFCTHVHLYVYTPLIEIYKYSVSTCIYMYMCMHIIIKCDVHKHKMCVYSFTMLKASGPMRVCNIYTCCQCTCCQCTWQLQLKYPLPRASTLIIREVFLYCTSEYTVHHIVHSHGEIEASAGGDRVLHTGLQRQAKRCVSVYLSYVYILTMCATAHSVHLALYIVQVTHCTDCTVVAICPQLLKVGMLLRCFPLICIGNLNPPSSVARSMVEQHAWYMVYVMLWVLECSSFSLWLS